jgi:hypothetical protein
MRDGEPISRGQLDRHGAELTAIRESIFAVALFGCAILINGILAILLIDWCQSIGWWDIPSAGGGEGTAELSGRLGRRPSRPE